MDQSRLTAGTHWETPLNTDLDIPDERQGCDTGTVRGTSGGGEWRR
jgi:hypothetical protein